MSGAERTFTSDAGRASILHLGKALPFKSDAERAVPFTVQRGLYHLHLMQKGLYHLMSG